MFLQAATSKCCILSDGTARPGLSQPLGAVRHMLGDRSRPCADLSSLENREHRKERIRALPCPALVTGGQDGTGIQCTPVVLAEV